MRAITFGQSRAVTVRFDDAPATTSTWNRSTDYKALGLWGSEEAIPFIKQLADTKRVVIRIQERDRLDAEFELEGVAEVAAQVAEAC